MSHLAPSSVHVVLGLLVFCVAAVSLFPFVFKPLSEDDGNWFYPAVFQRRGIRQHVNYWNYGYFGIPWIAAVLYALVGYPGIRFFQFLKIAWYALTAASVYGLALLLWGDNVVATVAGLSFALVAAMPANMFVFTYGEHFLILPANLTLLLAGTGLNADSAPLLVLSGIAAGWSIQIKPTALIFVVLAGLGIGIAAHSFVPVAYFGAGVGGISLLPVLLLITKGWGAAKIYLQSTFGPAWSFAEITLERMGLRRNTPMADGGFSGKDYIRQQHNKSWEVQRNSIRMNYALKWRQSIVLLLPAFAQLLLIALTADIAGAIVAAMLGAFLLMQVVQMNYHLPHFNHCWAPVCLLAAHALVGTLLPLSPWTGSVVLAVFVLTGLLVPLSEVAANFRASRHDFITDAPGPKRMLYRLAETIGRHISENSAVEDTLYVWGDYPSIYLYADRLSFHSNWLFFPYGSFGYLWQKERLLRELRLAPPSLIVFFKDKSPDTWDMPQVEKFIGVKYRREKMFTIADRQGRPQVLPLGSKCEFPLFRRDDFHYREVLLDRAVAAFDMCNWSAYGGFLDKILRLFPDDFEAALRKKFDEDKCRNNVEMKSILELRCSKTQDIREKATLLRMLASLELKLGNYSTAIVNCRQVEHLRSEDFRIHGILAAAHIANGAIEQARPHLESAIRANPYSPDVLNSIGVVLASSGEKEKACRSFKLALQYLPEHKAAAKNLEILRGA